MNDNYQITEHFSYDELKCKCGCERMECSAEFIQRLETARLLFAHPIHVSSGYRCVDHDNAVNGSGAHTLGAADLFLYGDKVWEFLRLALGLFSGIGLKQHGLHASRFLHVDNLVASEEPPRPRPYIWSYS